MTTATDLDSSGSAVPALRAVQMSAVVAHPANPREDLGDITELAESIGATGLIQSPVVLPADRVRGAWPQFADEIPDTALYVVLVGHRRRAAIEHLYGADHEMQVVVRSDAIADDALAQLDVMIAENTARKALTPMEEARAYQRAEQAGRGQDAIAKGYGVSQSHVSKRLKLLRLHEDAQAAVDAATLRIGDALELAAVDSALHLPVLKLMADATYPMRMEQAIRNAQAAADTAARTQASMEKAKEQGVKVVDPNKRFGGSAYSHRVVGEKALAAAREAGTLVAAIGHKGELDYYSDGPIKAKDNRTQEDERKAAAEKAKQQAAEAREETAALLAAAAPKLPEAASTIADALIARTGQDEKRMAMRWLTAAGIGGPKPGKGESYSTWWDDIAGRPWPVRSTAAHALALTRREIAVANSAHLDAHHLAWIEDLTAEGYVPNEWEQRRIDLAKARLHVAAHGVSIPEGTTQFLLWHSEEAGWCLSTIDEPTTALVTGGGQLSSWYDAQSGSAQKWAERHIGAALGLKPQTWDDVDAAQAKELGITPGRVSKSVLRSGPLVSLASAAEQPDDADLDDAVGDLETAVDPVDGSAEQDVDVLAEQAEENEENELAEGDNAVQESPVAGREERVYRLVFQDNGEGWSLTYDQNPRPVYHITAGPDIARDDTESAMKFADECLSIDGYTHTGWVCTDDGEMFGIDPEFEARAVPDRA
ncbi:ParB N-terminal domain-containing protein [Catellatospora sp. NPDC049133]|uniref:ParB/RepB/Spo0J family partition protein n=1 Tax=Catellatospora sp. NPDC049133 TaxID=3155499 RepID=UPI0033C630E7